MDSIEGLWEKFSLSEKEDSKVDLVDTTQRLEYILAAKFFTPRV